MTKLKENAVRIGTLNVPYKPQEVHRHLVTLPTGGRFAIFDPPEPMARSLETLLVFDARKKPDSTREAKRTVIGTVRLLPGAGGTTDIVFDAKDAVWGHEITEEKRALFYEYFQLVEAHFGVSEGCPASMMKLAELGDLDTMPQSAEVSMAGQSDSEPVDVDYIISVQRQHHKGSFNPDTAREVVKAIPEAANKFLEDGGRWGPAQFEPFCHVTKTTIGRYLKSLRAAGLSRIGGITLPGPGVRNPYPDTGDL